MADKRAIDRYRVKPGEALNFDKLDSSEKVLFDFTKEESLPVFDELRAEIKALQQVLYAENKNKVLIVIQAMDTGGKDGCVRHVFSSVDPQGVMVTPFKKPSEEEMAHDFLWRVHKHVPANGQIAIFNRSHYEDIIAVQVKELFGPEVWKPRYRHVVDFERMLAEEGTLVLKFFLHISKEEQRSRLQARLDNPAKHWKFNPDDLSDRARWDSFMTTYEEVLSKTSADHAPWYVIPSDRKWHRNLCVAQIIVDSMKRLQMSYPDSDWDPSVVKIS